MVYALLEALRTQVLVRAGLLFDQTVAGPVFGADSSRHPANPCGGFVQCLRDTDPLREFLTGAGLIAFCDAPWCPIFVVAAFVLHPWFGWIAIVGCGVIWTLTLVNEFWTRRDLRRANSASIEAGQHAAATFRNAEVLQAMGMLGALRARWSRCIPAIWIGRRVPATGPG